MLTRFFQKISIPMAFAFASATKTKKILIADLFSKDAIKNLEKQGNKILYNDKLKGKDLAKAIGEFKPEILVVRGTKIQAEQLNQGKEIEVVIRAGSGTDTIDIDLATKSGIFVANCPGKNATAVAELVMGLVLNVDRRIPENVIDLKKGKWDKGLYSKSKGVKGKTLGIIGYGYIGKELTQRARAFDMNVLIHDIKEPKQLEKNVKFMKMQNELLKKSDIVSLHVPKTKSTVKMVNKKFLALMKKDALLINTSRGDVVVEPDIIEHLNKNKNFWYAADVWAGEPADKQAKFTNKLAQHARCYGTHHIGASTNQAENAIGEEAYRMIVEYLKTDKVPNMVNKVDPSNARNVKKAPEGEES